MTHRRPAGDAAQRRRVLVSFAAFGAWWGAFGAVLPAVQRSAGVDDGELGAALLLVGVGAIASMRLAGGLIDRSGGAVLPLSLVALGAAGVAPALAEGVVPLGAALLALGVASGAVEVAINTAAAAYEQATGRPLMNLAHAGFSIGVIAAAATAGALRGAGLGATAVLTVMALALTTAAAGGHARWGRHLPQPAAHPDARTAQAPWPWWRPPARLAVLGALTGLAFLVENAWQSWSALHLERTLAAPAHLSALGPAVFGASAAAGRLAAQRLLRRLSDQGLVRAGAALAAAGTLAAATAPVTAVALAGIAAAGLGTAACAPTLLGLAGRGAGEARRGAAIGSVTTLAYLGFVAAPALVGLLSRATSLRLALAVVAVPAAALALAAPRAGRGRQAGSGPPTARTGGP